MKQIFEGELIEVGTYPDGCGMLIVVRGERLLFKLDVHQTKAAATKAAATHLFERVTITVEMGEEENR